MKHIINETHEEWGKTCKKIGGILKITCTAAVIKPRMLKEVSNEAMSVYYDPKSDISMI